MLNKFYNLKGKFFELIYRIKQQIMQLFSSKRLLKVKSKKKKKKINTLPTP